MIKVKFKKVNEFLAYRNLWKIDVDFTILYLHFALSVSFIQIIISDETILFIKYS